MPSQPTKYCDLVMKGGITSGIVYPNAVLALAKEFRFKNIGGTSAGAIAAAACAAAALGDRRKQAKAALAHNAAKVGFEGLEAVSGKLATQGFIYSLFQPAPGARNAYRLLVVLAGGAGMWRKMVAPFVAVVAIAPVEFLVLLVILFSLGYWIDRLPGVAAAALPALICAFAGAGAFAVSRVARVARRNLLGLCTGRRRPGRFGGGAPALTEWLHVVLQELSGKPIDQPLVFGDLWTADRYPDEPQSAEAITLRMITTGVSHHEPRSLPFDDATFWFRRAEFDLLFPGEVVDWMVSAGGEPVTIDGVDYHRLPARGDLPVLVAMRMSLSFPLLISAVPLHEPASRERTSGARSGDEQAQDAAPAERTIMDSSDALATSGGRGGAKITSFRVCWFSDGGISSNFPLHLFDAPLPRWPTFAIDLVYPDTADDLGQPEIFLPTENNQGWRRQYQSIARPSAVKELAGFMFGIIATMQNWRDLLQSRAPGHRDRIVHVSLTGEQGGMNLDMPQAVLSAISQKGTAAGEALKGFSFDNHYWVRWRNLASALQRYTIKVADSVTYEPKIPAYRDAYETARTGVPEPPSYKFTSQEQRAEAEKLLARLSDQGEEWKDLGPDLTRRAPRPLPQLQITPTY